MTADKQLLQDDLDARTASLDVGRSFIVQAPAGSGKTELLIQRYLKLLSIVEHPEEILAITFTNKATAEMQLRVLDALRRSQLGEQPREEFQKLTFELATAALSRSSELEWNLIGNPRRMRILTMDALNASLARAQPLSSAGSASGNRVVVGAELKSVHDKAALATLDWLAEKGAMQVATRKVLQHVDNNTWMYISYLSQMLATRDQWLPFVGSGALADDDAFRLRAKFEASLEFAVNEHLTNTAAAFKRGEYTKLEGLLDYAAANMLDAETGDSSICDLAGLTALPAATGKIQQWQGLAELLLTQQGLFRKRVNKRQGFPPSDQGQKDTLHELLQDMAGNTELATWLHGVQSLPPIRYTDEQWSVLLALFRLLPLAVIELKRLFAEQGIADYTDIALTAGAALGTAEDPGDIALLLDYQVRHVLVDEMQDTSSAQYGMLESLTGGWEQGDGRTLYCVGDPMQSIYRFRNAEVGRFLLAREHGIGHILLEPLLLRQNFRSGEKLVEWFNEVFPSMLSPRDDPLRAAVSYSKSVPVQHLEGQGSCVVHPVFGADADLEATAGCDIVAKTLANHPGDDMAVLVRSRTHLPQFLAALRNAGIAYRAVEIDRLTDLPEIIDVLALTRAAVHLSDRVAWLGILRAPWMGLEWNDLHALTRNDTSSTIWELLQDSDRLSSLSTYAQEVIAASRGILNNLTTTRRAQSLRDLIERTWIALGGPGALDDDYAVENVYSYFDVLGKMERAGTLMDVAELESILDLERVSTTGDARLQIMTIHRAKGLQFDHVLLYGLGRAPGSGDRRVLSWFDMPGQHGEVRKIISPVGPRAEVDNDPVHRYIELTEAEKGRHEQARLLYVACTRARKSLHLMGNTKIAPDGESFRPARSDSLLHLLWPAVEPDFTRSFAKHTVIAPAQGKSIWVDPLLRRFVSSWQLPEVALLPGSQDVGDVQDDTGEVEFYWVGTEARIAGTLVHRWLQLMANGRANPMKLEPSDFRPVTERWLREMGVANDMSVLIVERVEAAVSGMLDDERGRWILDGDGHAELGLSGEYEGEISSVVLDRVRIDDDGTHWIIDYKTSSHEGGNLQGFLQSEAERYRPQLARYASIYGAWAKQDVKCALYFPLLRSFVEV